MNIISSVNLKNFRGFKNSGKIRLAPLTFLVGPNSSGKSTIADSILLTSQSMSGHLLWSTPNWIGRLVDLGSYEDTVYGHKVSNSISIELGFAVDLRGYYRPTGPSKPFEISLRWTMRSEKGSLSGKVSSMIISDLTSGAEFIFTVQATQLLIEIEGRKISVPNSDYGMDHTIYTVRNAIKKELKSNSKMYQKSKAGYNRLHETLISHVIPFFLSRIERVSSARSGPKRWFAKDTLIGSGETQSGLLNDAYTMNLDATSHGRPRNRRLLSTLKEPVSKYLDELGIASALTREDLSAYHTALKVTDNVTNVRSNLADVGFGASQAIPVIRGCVSENDSPLIIEQPEIHLHPKAQGELARLICMTSKTRQVVVETHSEHMINRARILVADKKINPMDVTIIYVDRVKNGSIATEIGIDENGDFTREWPEGFFDERYRDSITLLELKSNEGRVVVASRDIPRR